MRIIYYAALISMVFNAVNSDNKGCLYGWYLSDDRNTCYVNCLTSQLYFSSVYCNFIALKSTKLSYNSSNNILKMAAGETMGSKGSLVPPCYDVTLRNDQYDVTTDGFIQIATNLMEIPLKNVIKITPSNVTLCYPSSPQLLQCHALSAPPGSYKIVSGSMLLVPDRNITALLGDFYVNEKAIAFFCAQSSPIVSFSELPRCNVVALQHEDYRINVDGSMTVHKANITINNPLYSINYSQLALVCLPLNFNFLNCPHKKEVAQYYYYSYPNLTLLNLFYRGLVTPLDYYITIDKELMTCVDHRVLSTAPVILSQLYQGFSVLSGLTLLVTVIWRFKMFTRNYPSCCLLCHIVSLIVMYFGLATELFYTNVEIVSCYVIFVASYSFKIAAFFWLNVVAYDSWRFFSRIQTVKSLCRLSCDEYYCRAFPRVHFLDNEAIRFVFYNVFCWGLTAVLTAVILFLDFSVSPYDFRYEIRPYVLPSCFFATYKSFIVFYYFPMALSTVINLIFLGLTIRILRRASAGTELVNCKRRKQVFIMSMKLFVLMGFCWTIDCICYGFASFNISVFQNWFLSVGLTNLQGVIVSIIYGPQNHALTNVCPCQNKPKCR